MTLTTRMVIAELQKLSDEALDQELTVYDDSEAHWTFGQVVDVFTGDGGEPVLQFARPQCPEHGADCRDRY